MTTIGVVSLFLVGSAADVASSVESLDHFNRFSTDVEKSRLDKPRRLNALQLDRRKRVVILCQPERRAPHMVAGRPASEWMGPADRCRADDRPL